MLKELNNVFHKKAFAEYHYDVRSLGWGSSFSQNSRFQTMIEAGVITGDSVLDLGCGFGDLSRYLRDKNINVDYFGVDINNDFIKKAKESSLDNCTFINGDISSVHPKKFDWVLSSGIFSFDCSGWKNEVCTTMRNMFETCNKGISANFLSAYSPHDLKEGFRYVKPHNVVEMLTPLLSNKFVVRHDYKENDFTLYFYK